MITHKLKDRKAMRAELPLSVNIPFAAHIARTTIKNHSGDFVRVFRLAGIAHDSADDQDINVWHEQLGYLLRTIASPHLAVWSHIVRRIEQTYPVGDYAPGFASRLNSKYRDHCLSGASMLVNELYITLVYRPAANRVDRFFGRFEKLSRESLLNEQLAGLAALDELEDTVKVALQRYDAEVLGVYQHRGRAYSELLEFFGFLVNGEWQPMPLPQGDLRSFIATSRPFFGTESLAYKAPAGTRYGAILGIKEYPAITGPGMLDALMAEPYEFILTQSFVFMNKQEAQRLLERQRAVMINAGDLAASQIDELELAMDDLISNRFVFGRYHFTLQLLAASASALRDCVGQARTVLSDTGMVVAREDSANEAAYWAQLPGNFEFRTRPAPLTSRNFAGLSAFHNYPTGKRERNHWGPAVTLLRTASGGPLYFNFHRFDVGNTTIIGPTGSGKTATQNFMISQLQKFDPTIVFIDLNAGARIYICAMRGRYQSLTNGIATGWNPLQLEPTAANLEFIEAWLRNLARARDGAGRAIPLNSQEDGAISKAVAGVMELPRAQRRLTQVLSFLDVTDTDGIYYRIARWSAGHQLGWVFDNATDSLDFNACKMFGFDMTELLDNDEVRTNALFYLMYRIDCAMDGRRFVCFMDEFWRLLQDAVFEDFANRKLKTIRKQNGFLVFGTQSAKDTLRSPIAHTIIEQCPTLILMPNPKATHEDYVDGLHCSEREFDIVKTLPEGSRQFLVKQGHNSVIAELNLRGFDDELAVLSGTTANNALLDQLLAQVGTDPDIWLPLFHQRRTPS
ncbi:VirB4 family type IV secretion/conjugal transfer ATPase [Massilia soli]|uniref:VirB4 family type IV secretion/conjugal transfer ATPase n=1 Tax=Massilia soli TaxID=2792854 RepID=A0ABS7SPV1_9BURK|nr:VirB4 family type IV secretion/conjugal transfer ATPase [Massilia soli]MBZ2207150.1 VirB4 family type IV secretion/conjugal transfer ATPase [Massilia soli]